MKSNNNYNNGSRKPRSVVSRIAKTVVLSSILLTTIMETTQAQATQYSKPSWWFGAAAGANFNFYRGTTQELNYDLTVPTPFHNGNGTGVYAAPLIEYHRPNTMLGAMLQVGYDSRRGYFDQVLTPCNCPAELSTKLSYISIEPSLRLAPFKSGFYLYAGPRISFNLENTFAYNQKPNPLIPGQIQTPVINGEWSKMDYTKVSMQVGAGYDIALSSKARQTQWVFSPFVSFMPYFGQSPRLIESWNITTVRAGAAIKFGRGTKVIPLAPKPAEVIAVQNTSVVFFVHAPKNIATERNVREIFPLRNYIFFNVGSTEISDRYELLRKDQVKDFKEDQLEMFTPKNMTGRSTRQMNVYYNMLNILGDRMGKNPATGINLVGSSELGIDDGRAMAESIKKYLVTVFGINALRITTEGSIKPVIPSQQPGQTHDLDLLRAGDRRVSVESSSPILLMEFQSGKGAQLKPVEIMALQKEPFDSYVTFNTIGAIKEYSSWSMQITDESGKIQYFGPFTQDVVRLSGKSILGNRPMGDYKVKMTGITKKGTTEVKETNVHMMLWTPTKVEEGMRFSVLYEFDDAKAIDIYEKYLTNVVVPKIAKNGTVIIHGHTDIIGDETYNQKLSIARANDVKNIMDKELDRLGRKDVDFEVIGFGEDQVAAPFENNFPEERFYNRTVVIDIIPGK